MNFATFKALMSTVKGNEVNSVWDPTLQAPCPAAAERCSTFVDPRAEVRSQPVAFVRVPGCQAGYCCLMHLLNSQSAGSILSGE